MIVRPMVRDEAGTIRFRTNHIVRYLLDLGPFDLNHLARVSAFSQEDWQEFYQLIGYSVSGYSELSCVDDATLAAVDEAAKEVVR